MQIDETAHVIVHAEDLSVTVNGLQANCLTPDMIPEKMRTMTWRPEDKPRGHFHGMPDGTHEFDDFARFEPFIAAWQPFYDAWIKADAEHKAHLANVAKENAALEEKAKADAEKFAPLSEALNGLGSTDHKVIQAMEADLAARGVLSPDFKKQRDEWRATAKAEKAKHGIK